MPSITNQSNLSRVSRIVDALDLIEKSARSNKASQDELSALINPVFAKLGDLGFIAGAYGPDASTGQGTQEPAANLTAGQRAALALADQASLRELICALTGRLEAHAAKIGDGE